jgi:hypothetical protein
MLSHILKTRDDIENILRAADDFPLLVLLWRNHYMVSIPPNVCIVRISKNAITAYLRQNGSIFLKKSAKIAGEFQDAVLVLGSKEMLQKMSHLC